MFFESFSIFQRPCGAFGKQFGSWLCQLPNNFHVALKECGMTNTLKIKLTVLFLNNFSNAPAAGHFHKQKVMLPCTLNMRKGVKGLKPIHC
jgi:hypothetical protein